MQCLMGLGKDPKRCNVANHVTETLLTFLIKETIAKTLEHQSCLANSKQERRWLYQTLHARPIALTEAERQEFFLLTRLSDNQGHLRESEGAASGKVRTLREQLAKEKERARKAQGKEEGEWLEDWWNPDGTSNYVGGAWTNPGGSNPQEEAGEDEEDDDVSDSEAEEVEEPELEAKDPKRVSGWAVLNR